MVIDARVLAAALADDGPSGDRARARLPGESLTVYDAGYVSLAEALGALLLTADQRLAHAAWLRCQVEVLT